MNNLIGILLRWREEQVALVGDIRKMFHSIHLKPFEQHFHRFLWRNLEIDREPDVYVMTQVNMGNTPAHTHKHTQTGLLLNHIAVKY